MNPAILGPILTAAGILGNLIWTILNLRVQNRVLRIEKRIAEKITELKDWADKRYVAKPEYVTHQQDVLRRLKKLEGAA